MFSGSKVGKAPKSTFGGEETSKSVKMVTSFNPFPRKKRCHRVAQNAISELYVGGVPTWTSRSLHDKHDPAEKADKHPKSPKKTLKNGFGLG